MDKVTPAATVDENQPTTETLHHENAVKDNNTTKKAQKIEKVLFKTESTDAEHEAATKLQAFWRMRNARTAYREKIRNVHKMTFAFALLIRLAVLAYLSIILVRVKRSMDFKFRNDPANADEIEQIVLQQLLAENYSGVLNIVFCRLVFK